MAPASSPSLLHSFFGLFPYTQPIYLSIHSARCIMRDRFRVIRPAQCLRKPLPVAESDTAIFPDLHSRQAPLSSAPPPSSRLDATSKASRFKGNLADHSAKPDSSNHDTRILAKLHRDLTIRRFSITDSPLFRRASILHCFTYRFCIVTCIDSRIDLALLPAASLRRSDR